MFRWSINIHAINQNLFKATQFPNAGRMVTRRGSRIRKSRKKLTIPLRKKGKLPITKYLAKFEDNSKVILKRAASVQKGIYHMRFHGKVGVVEGKQGMCYKVTIRDGSKQKTLIVHPVHLKKMP